MFVDGGCYQPREPGPPLNGPTTRRRDPAAVEATGLGDDELVVDEARVHAAGVERDVVARAARTRRSGWRRPTRPRSSTAFAAAHGEVVRAALPLAERAALGGHERAGRDVVGREVVVRRVAGLEHAVRARRVGDGHAAEHDDEVRGRRLEARRTRVRPTPTPGPDRRDRVRVGSRTRTRRLQVRAYLCSASPVFTTSNALPGTVLSWFEVVVVPAGVLRAADEPVAAVVGDDHPVLLQRVEHDARLAGVAPTRRSSPSAAGAAPSAAGSRRSTTTPSASPGAGTPAATSTP